MLLKLPFPLGKRSGIRRNPKIIISSNVKFKKNRKCKSKNKSKVKCLYYGKNGHFAEECKEFEVRNPSTSFVHVLSCTFITKSNSLWVMDLGATYHIVRDCVILQVFLRDKV